MTLEIGIPERNEFKPKITVFGVGGAGGNAVNNMIDSKLQGVSFVVANTDAQALENSNASERIQLGSELTKGLGAGASPEIGEASAVESQPDIEQYLEDCNMVFITAGMGGGTGTGAAPVIAKFAREKRILTVGVVTKPFNFEGAHRMKIADAGIAELQQYVDTLIVIPNQNLFRIANEKTTFADAFSMADNVLHAGVRGVTDLIVMPGLINLDFADIRTVMSEMGKAMMGTGEAEGESRAQEAAEAAISNPLLDNISMKGARGVLINITGGADMTLFEVDEAANRIREEVDADANIIFGSTFDPNLEGKLRVSVISTGIESNGKALNQEDQLRIKNGSFSSSNKSFNSVSEKNIKIKEKNEEFLREKVEVEFKADNTVSAESKDEFTDPSNEFNKPVITTSGYNNKPQKKSGGFFGNLFGGRKKKEESAIEDSRQRIRPSVTTSTTNRKTDRSDSDVMVKERVTAEIENSEEMFDIPAFLRKKD
jgi:cell division protein FtsZ